MSEAKYLEMFPNWLRALGEDAVSMGQVLPTDASDDAKRHVTSGLNYIFKSLDLIPDGIDDLGFLDDAVHAGKINYIGLSNFTGWQMQLAISTAKAMGLHVPVTLQPQYSLVSREIEFEIVPAAVHNGIGLLPWSPLAGGFLSGKYTKDARADDGTRASTGDPMTDHIFGDLAAKDQNWDTVDAVRDIATKLDVTPSQVALSWLVNRPTVTAPIIGAKTLRQLEENIVASNLDLGEEFTETLDTVSTPKPNDYPYGPFGVKQRYRYIDSSDQAISEIY